MWARTMPTWPCVRRGGKRTRFIKGTRQRKSWPVLPFRSESPTRILCNTSTQYISKAIGQAISTCRNRINCLFVCLCFIHKIAKQRGYVDVFRCQTDKYTNAGGSNVPFRCRNPPQCIQAWLTLSPWRPSYSAVAVSWLHGRLTFSLLKDLKKKEVLNAGEHKEECNRFFRHTYKYIITIWRYSLSFALVFFFNQSTRSFGLWDNCHSWLIVTADKWKCLYFFHQHDFICKKERHTHTKKKTFSKNQEGKFQVRLIWEPSLVVQREQKAAH